MRRMADLVTGRGGPREVNAPVTGWGRTRNGRLRAVVVLFALVAVALATVAVAGQKPGEALPATNDIATLTMADLGHALLCMVVAAALGALLALRPRRAGGPPRLAHVIQTQIMLAIIGSLVMLIVGASLARAFAIAGVAGLVRYRSKIGRASCRERVFITV